MPHDANSKTRVTILRRLASASVDKEAWSQFVEHYGARIYRWCKNSGLQEADAEDLTQDLLLKLASQMRTFEYDPARSFHAWLKTITNHALVDSFRKNQRARDLLDNAASRTALIEELQPQFDKEVLDEAMARVELRVEKNTWEAFRLTGLEHLPASEAASQLQLTEGQVRVYKGRVVKLIRDEVHKLEGSATEGPV
jgi:RNA polymerase sigma factor (sigma-70 family)